MNIEQSTQTLLRDGFILVFNQDKLDIVKTAGALLEAGIGNMEVTCRISQPLEKIRQLRKALPDFVVGAASLVDFPGMLKVYNRRHAADPLPDVDEVVEAGVDYLVSAANFSEATYEKYAGKLPIIPGCGTVSEMVRQYALGATFVKMFPANIVGGPKFVKSVDPAIHKIISIVPTGGTNESNIPDYIAAGVLVLGGSFSAIDKAVFQEIIDKQDYKRLAAELAGIKQMIDELRAKQWPMLDFTAVTVEQVSLATGRDFNIA
ncbi:MAG: bifunctional 4-hydroxy-2-oxoglutarate aldolase/2-dehydro-3-deoxy-phosphogluconate aldolase [Phycisphaerae bacterium]|nr:bifunctional 4-hydroxy-2-oxoglutarate aldolase/2-dehydro-3-deoxy-phosphogluconate aldolase [Phycisphaerae bacterium]